MSEPLTAAQLGAEEVKALKFAAHRQLARSAKKPRLSPDQQAQRNALKRAAAVLREPAFARGCDVRARGPEEKR